VLREPLRRRTAIVPADLLLLAIVLLWAFNFTAIRYAVSHGFAPLTYAPLRWAIAAVAFCAATWRLEGSFRVGRRDLVLLAGIGAVGIWANQTALTYASQLASAATVALTFGILPVLVGLLSHIAGVQRLRVRDWAGIALSVAGVALIAAGGGRLSGHVGGVLLAVLTAATFAVYSVAVVPLMRRHSPYRISAVTGVIGALLLACTGSWQLADQDWSMGALAWGALLYSALASGGLGNLLWFKVIDRVGPGRAAVYVNLQPFLGAVFAVLVLSESLTWLQVAGGLVVGTGIVVARVRPTSAPPAEYGSKIGCFLSGRRYMIALPVPS
jgi:drug/metabolite transporter (DMT)-like permease